MQLPVLDTEVQQYMKELELPDITNNELNVSSITWKKLVKKAIIQHCEKYFSKKLPNNKKLVENMNNEKFERKCYINDMTMKEAQTYFKYRTHMINAKFNYKNDKNYREELWRCDSCKSAIDTQSHILMTCPGYQHLRVNKNFDNDHDLVKFFQQVIDLRESVDK